MNKEWVETAMRLASKYADADGKWLWDKYAEAGTMELSAAALVALEAHLNTPNTDQVDSAALKAAQERIADLERENRVLTVKTTNSLANNLCPDHRDKQAGKLCLACGIEAAEARIRDQRDSAVAYKPGSFAGWFRELPSAMSYRLWEQGGYEPEAGEVALYTR